MSDKLSSLAQRSVALHVTPPACTLRERRSILNRILKFGDVDLFGLRQVHDNGPQPVIHVLFREAKSAKALINAAGKTGIECSLWSGPSQEPDTSLSSLRFLYSQDRANDEAKRKSAPPSQFRISASPSRINFTHEVQRQRLHWGFVSAPSFVSEALASSIPTASLSSWDKKQALIFPRNIFQRIANEEATPSLKQTWQIKLEGDASGSPKLQRQQIKEKIGPRQPTTPSL